MPIKPIVLQRRMAELGRIRLGDKNKDRGFPQKLEKFRFTSPSEEFITDLATLYGGIVRPWENNGKAEWEVYTEAASIPVVVIKGGCEQWMTTYSGGGCVHKCDGEINKLTGEFCDPNDPAHIDAKPTTYLSVMLPELDAIGAWTMVSRGWNAAAELPMIAEIAQYVGDLVPADLMLQQRKQVRDGKTSRFVVPVLVLRVGARRLQEVVAAKSGAELVAPAAAAALPSAAEVPAAAPALAAPAPDYRAAANDALDVDDVRALWNQAAGAGHLDDALRAYLTARVETLREAVPAAPAPAPAGQPPVSPAAAVPDTDGVVDAVLVDDHEHAANEAFAEAMVPTGQSADQVWEQIVRAAGERGIGLADLQDQVFAFLSVPANEASAEELAMYLVDLTRDAA